MTGLIAAEKNKFEKRENGIINAELLFGKRKSKKKITPDFNGWIIADTSRRCTFYERIIHVISLQI